MVSPPTGRLDAGLTIAPRGYPRGSEISRGRGLVPKLQERRPRMRVDRDFRELFPHPALDARPGDASTNPRAAILVPARVTSEEGEMTAAIQQLSAGGARLRVPRLLHTGAEVQLDIELPGGRVSVSGVVRSAYTDDDGLEGIGVQLVDPSPQARQALAAHAADQNRRRSAAKLATG